MEPVTYVLIVLLSAWTCLLIMWTRHAHRYWEAAQRYEQLSKQSLDTQDRINKTMTEREELYKEARDELEGKIVEWEERNAMCDRYHEEQKDSWNILNAKVHRLIEDLQSEEAAKALLGERIPVATATRLAKMIADADTVNGVWTVSRLLLALCAAYPEHAWVSLVSQYAENPNRWTIDKVHRRAAFERDED